MKKKKKQQQQQFLEKMFFSLRVKKYCFKHGIFALVAPSTEKTTFHP